MMETTKMSLAEQLKMEIMERYGLREDQVRLELSISTTDLETGRTILADFDRGTRSEGEEYLSGNHPCDSVYSTNVNQVIVFRKNGFYGEWDFDVNVEGDDIE